MKKPPGEGTGKRRKGPKPPTLMSDALGAFLEKSGLATRIEEASVVPEWERLVGKGIADVTVPLRVSRGILFVTVRSSGWLMELKLMEGEIIRRLNAGRPRGKINKIRFLMAGE